MITKLDEGLVSHLAAGEVIERPSSIIRECIDNSIDALSTKINISVLNGGIDSLIIDDNGKGISKDDITRIALPHATSKIHTLDDIYNIITMGFRGEALFSMTSVGDLSIESNDHGIDIINLKRSEIYKSTKEKGTRITLKNLFKNLPARYAFLSNGNIESTRNNALIVEKALAFPNIEFKYSNNNIDVLHYNIESHKDRVSRFLRNDDFYTVNEIAKTSDDFILKLFYVDGALRRDRKKVKIYVNNRSVTDQYLMSAILYAFKNTTPGGFYPEAVIFINNDPSLTDFNVHPQKRECRLRNAHAIHHEIATIFDNFKHNTIRQVELTTEDLSINEENNSSSNVQSSSSKQPNDSSKDLQPITSTHSQLTSGTTFINENNTNNFGTNKVPSSNDYGIFSNFLKNSVTTQDAKPVEISTSLWTENESAQALGFTYIGQIWNLFLLYTIDDTLYIIDQHAAAERVMFDKLRKHIQVQELLFPLTLEVDISVSRTLDTIKDTFIEKGIMIEKIEDCLWKLKAMPTCLKNSERDVIKLIETANEKDIDTKLYAIIACHNSIRGGASLPREDAINLISDVLKLEELVCPHGRSFVTKIDKKYLEELVLRD